MKILVLPRDGLNPYQRLLYGPLERGGARIAYAGELTPSHTLNVLLLPLELIARRLTGWHVLHLHWVYFFTLPLLGRRASAVWFRLVLAVTRAAGIRLVWTAHNVLPHQAVFPDDVAERRRLLASADLVIAHSEAALAELTQTVAAPSEAVVIPHGPYGVPAAHGDRDMTGPLRLLFFGQVAAYKGVEDLLTALERVGNDDLTLTIAGQCHDDALAARLEKASERLPQVTLRLGHVEDENVPSLLHEHEVFVLPFRRATTSGSVLLGLEAGLPVVVPALAAFDGMPVTTYEPGVDGLTEALRELAHTSREELRAAGAEGSAWISRHASWDDVAERTAEALAGPARPSERSSVGQLT